MMKPAAPSLENREAAAQAASMRRCLATSQSFEKESLIRFVVSPEGELVADIYGRLSGRGAWVKAEKQHLETAISKNLFARFLRHPVKIKDGFIDLLGGQLTQILIGRMSLMRKSGLLITGRGKLEMAASRLVGLLIADDASQREAASLQQLVQPSWCEKSIPAHILGHIAGVESLAYAGVLQASHSSEEKQIDALLIDLARWRAVTQTQKQENRS